MYAASEGTYGSPRIQRALNDAGLKVSRKRVARLMHQAGLRARAARIYRTSPGSHAFFIAVPNWGRTRWSLGHNKTTELTLRALSRAVANRRPRCGLVFHSDRGVEYAAYEFRTRLAALGIRQSMNRPGEPTDNAHMESFFHSLKTERLYGCSFATDAELRRALQAYIAFYNPVSYCPTSLCH